MTKSKIPKSSLELVGHSFESWACATQPEVRYVRTSNRIVPTQRSNVKPKVKTVAEKLSFKLRIWPENLPMDILRDSQHVIFSHSTTFITFPYKRLAGFLLKFLQSSRRRKPEVALKFCVWTLCGSFQGRSFHDRWSRGTKTLGTRVWSRVKFCAVKMRNTKLRNLRNHLNRGLPVLGADRDLDS